MVIAQGTGNKHISVKELIGDYTKEFRTLGTLSVLNRESNFTTWFERMCEYGFAKEKGRKYRR